MKINLLLFILIFNFKFLYAKDLSQEANSIFKNLRCLVCQGQSIADSNSDFAQTIKIVVKDKISEGKSEKEVYQFLTEKYGEWILYNPPFNITTSFLWLLPYLAFIFGGILIFLLIKKRNNS